MRCTKNSESQFDMEREYNLTLLLDKKQVIARGIIRRGNSVHVETWEGEIPIYAFKMNAQLMSLLKNEMEAWYE